MEYDSLLLFLRFLSPVRLAFALVAAFLEPLLPAAVCLGAMIDTLMKSRTEKRPFIPSRSEVGSNDSLTAFEREGKHPYAQQTRDRLILPENYK